jgi:cell volume regulation protein A
VNPVALFLLSIAGIFLVGVTGEVLFRRTGVPDVVWLVLAGILLGPVSGAVPRESLAAMAPYFAALTLVVILFEGGIRLRLREVSRAAPRSGVLALLTFVAAAAVVAVVSMMARLVGGLPPGWSWAHGLLLGAILGGSSSIIIMPAMTLANVESRVANLLSLESAFTDALCVVGATALIQVLTAGPGGAESPGTALLRTFGLGLVLGGAAGGLWLLLLRWLRAREHAYPVTLSALLILYVLIQQLGGSAALGILTFAVVVGNASAIGSMIGVAEELDLGLAVRGVHGQIAFIIKSFFFTFIGAMLGPPWSLLVLGVLLGIVLLVARWPAVRLVTLGPTFLPWERDLITVAYPRGMAAGVLATLPAAAGVPATEELSTVVFACVLTTVLVFAVGFPIVRRRGQAATRPAEPDGAPS